MGPWGIKKLSTCILRVDTRRLYLGEFVRVRQQLYHIYYRDTKIKAICVIVKNQKKKKICDSYNKVTVIILLYSLQNGWSGLVSVYNRMCGNVFGSPVLAIMGAYFFQWPNDRIPISAQTFPSGF